MTLENNLDPGSLPDPDSVKPDTFPSGPRTKAPTYYISERYRGRLTAKPDAERHPNGALHGTRNKAARRLIRKAFGKSLSRVEQKILKARDVRLEVERLATNSHEARRYVDKTLALHEPRPQPPTRSEAREEHWKAIRAQRDAIQEARVEAQEHQREAQAKRDAELAKLTPDRPTKIQLAWITTGGVTTVYTVDPGFKP